MLMSNLPDLRHPLLLRPMIFLRRDIELIFVITCVDAERAIFIRGIHSRTVDCQNDFFRPLGYFIIRDYAAGFIQTDP